MHQGRCALPADETGRVLDRMAGLKQIIRHQDIQQALAAAGRVNSRRCILTHEVTLWVVLAMGLFTDLPIRQVFKQARRLRHGEDSPHRSSLCVARQRLGIEPVRNLFDQVVRPLALPETPGAFYHGLRLMGIDGTVLDVPDSDVNLLPHLTPEMLLLLDRGFFSYEQWRKLTEREINVLARVSSRLILRPVRTLADGSYIAKIYKNDYSRQKDRDGIEVRVIRYTLNDPQRVGHGEEHVLITNLFDEAVHPAEDLIILYHQRWEHELVFDEQKTHHDPRRATKPAQLRSETPTGVMQEVYALSLGHFIIRSRRRRRRRLTRIGCPSVAASKS
jgi:hypothetical protein